MPKTNVKKASELILQFFKSVLSFLKIRLVELRELLFPRFCPICDHRLSIYEKGLCTYCFASLPFTDFHGAKDNPMERLFYPDLPIEKANAYIFYHRGSDARRAVFSLKYFGHPELGIPLGRAMAEDVVATGFFDGIDAIVPIPLSKRRQKRRGYNQSEYLARGVAQITMLPVWTDVVARTKDNATQTTLTHEERYRNVEGIFACVAPEKVAGRHLLLVDDVVTTVSTMKACMTAIRESAPDVRFSVLSLCLSASVTEFPTDRFEKDFII